jgi:hypothetical protein
MKTSPVVYPTTWMIVAQSASARNSGGTWRQKGPRSTLT